MLEDFIAVSSWKNKSCYVSQKEFSKVILSSKAF
jgi:hypothetical protein